MFSQACVTRSVHRGGRCDIKCIMGYVTWSWGGGPVPGGGHLTPPPPPQDRFTAPIREVWSMCGRYASYWNAILFKHVDDSCFLGETVHEARQPQVPDGLRPEQWLLHDTRVRQGRVRPQGGATARVDVR